ncbi:YdcF family protein [Roseomonas xinghualingensis]|uniref:YdcF family protein n=1 Tax=Roseomonas xinghualingensis TaxID=2986475 RepID=UPI0036706834
MLCVVACLAGILLAWRGWRPGLILAALAAIGQILFATPLTAGLLVASLEREVAPGAPASGTGAGAIIVLGAEVARTQDGRDVGPLTLERLRTGAALHRRTGLPLLVTGGALASGDEPIAELMAQSLRTDFGVSVRWIEPRARDTWENAALSVALLREAGIGSAYVVTHGWHMPRALAVFDLRGLTANAAPVRMDRVPDGFSSWVPRTDRWTASWLALREWAGRVVYALRA